MSTEQKLLPCRCGKTPRLVDHAGSAIHVSCSCGLQLWGSKAHFGSLQDAAKEWNTRAAQSQAAEGLPERMSLFGSDGQPTYETKAWNACHDAFMPHVNARDARIAELVAELKQTAATAFESINKCIELEALLAKGKEGLPEPYAWADPESPGPMGGIITSEFKATCVTSKGIRNAPEHTLPLVRLDSVTPAFATMRAENERLDKFAWQMKNIADRKINEATALRAELAEVVGVLRDVHHAALRGPYLTGLYQRCKDLLAKHHA